MTAEACLPELSPETHRPHGLHAPDVCWPETNCSMDLWIELLHALGLPPEPALAICARQDFEADQFGFSKVSPADLERLYGLNLQELAIYDPVEVHIERQIARRRLCLVEVDPFFLPDTGQAAYGRRHGKTTIGVNRIDAEGRRLEYFHNGGYFALEGEDFEGLLRPETPAGTQFRPYAEFTTVEPERLELTELKRRGEALLAEHWARRPAENPVRRFQAVLPIQAEALAGRDEQAFHDFAFHKLRMLGGNFSLLGACLEWLSDGTDPRCVHARAIAETAKVLTLHLVRALARRRFDGLARLLDPAAEAWDALFLTSSALEAA